MASVSKGTKRKYGKPVSKGKKARGVTKKEEEEKPDCGGGGGREEPAQRVIRIVVFGSSGSGKSSMIRVVTGDDSIAVSNGSHGCTFSWTQYIYKDEGTTFELYDTAGLDESDSGKVPSVVALENLLDLATALLDSGGINLFVYVKKQGRSICNTDKKNWELFTQTIGLNSVPAVMVVTGCELYRDMNAWIYDNWEGLRSTGVKLNNRSYALGVAVGFPPRHACEGAESIKARHPESRRLLLEFFRRTASMAPIKIVEEGNIVEWFTTVLGVLSRGIESVGDAATVLSTRVGEVIRGVATRIRPLKPAAQRMLTALSENWKLDRAAALELIKPLGAHVGWE